VRVALDPETVAVLDEHRLRMAQERTPLWRYYGLVFPDPSGDPFHRSAILREWHEACDRAGIPRRRFHDMRHTSAHLMNDLGVDEKTRMARLGHSTVSMSRHYSGASEAQDRLAVERLGEALA
jgi:integrase